MSTPDLGFLKTSPLFTGFGEEHFATMIELVTVQEWAPGDVIVEEGAPGDSFFILLSGQVQIEKMTPEGYPRPLALLEKQGEFFGEMAVVDILHRSATARAYTRAATVMFSKEALVRLFDTFPETMTLVAFNIARVLSTRLRSTDEDLAALSG